MTEESFVSTRPNSVGTVQGRRRVTMHDIRRSARDVLNDLLAGALRCLSHRPLLSGYDEQQTLP